LKARKDWWYLSKSGRLREGGRERGREGRKYGPRNKEARCGREGEDYLFRGRIYIIIKRVGQDKQPPPCCHYLPDVFRWGGATNAQKLVHVLPQILKDVVTVAIFIGVKGAVQVEKKDLLASLTAASSY